MTALREQYLGPANGNGNGRANGAAVIHRDLPFSEEAEQALLGSMLISRDVIDDCRAQLGLGEPFLHPAHRTIYGELMLARDTGIPVDPVTFTQLLRDQNLLDQVGGHSYVTQLFTMVPSASNFRHYLGIVREKFVLREIIASCTETTQRAFEEQDDVEGLLNDYAGRAVELGLRAEGDRSVHISEFVPEAVAQIEALYKNRGQITGLATGFIDFDRMTNGLEKGYNYVIGARPAMGKTSWALGIADYIAVRNAEAGKVVQIFSLEMTGTQLAKRLICAAANLSLSAIRFGFLPKEGLDLVVKAAAKLVASQIRITDKAGLNIYEFRAQTRNAVLKHKAGLIMVDYLQMMHGVSRRARENRQLEVSECIQGIAETAKELQVPIVTMAQLNRGPDERKWGIPEMSDLRESGDIENYAHLIGLLWRPVYYCKNDADKVKCARWLKLFVMEKSSTDGELHPVMDENDEPTPDLEAFERYAQLIITKQREGATGPCPLWFVKEFARFESATEKLFSNNPEERQGGRGKDEDDEL